ncbi:MAG: 50S ribosomal protein L11 methyltransferase [Paludibacteraceae bacterium]|nr:50S ribosomal protein L11 methyltransferase [Paludibacteraceae bacterium]
MQYSVAHFQTSFAEQWQADVFAQALCDIGFDTIEDTPSDNDNSQMVNCQMVQSLSAYIPTAQLDKAALQALVAQTEGVSLLSVEECPDENWNAVWENEHAAEQLPMDVVIIPHCAFGAGHHETTSMMTDALMERDLSGCRVLDNGCGTGVLGIFAAKRGANSVIAIDIDDKSVENTLENAARNGVTIETKQGTLESLADDIPSTGPYDLILSNIHRNILLSQLPLYAQLSKEVWLSGFYEDDAPALIAAAEEVGFRLTKQRTRNNWCMLCLHS